MTGFFEGTGGEANPLPHQLTEHTDVTITAAVDQEILRYDAASNSWINDPESSQPPALDDITDVTAPTPTNGQFLAWNDGAGYWEPQTGAPITSSSLNDLTDVTSSDATNGQILVYTAGQWLAADFSDQIGAALTVGTGAHATNAELFLDAGTLTSDGSSLSFRHGGVDKFLVYSIKQASGDYRFNFFDVTAGTFPLIFEDALFTVTDDMLFTDAQVQVTDSTSNADGKIYTADYFTVPSLHLQNDTNDGAILFVTRDSVGTAKFVTLADGKVSQASAPTSPTNLTNKSYVDTITDALDARITALESA